MPPRTLKRGTAARPDPHPSDSSSASPPPTQRRRGRHEAPAASDSDSDDEATTQTQTQTQAPSSTNTNSSTNTQTLIKKLVRLALACEYARTPIRRADISAKVLGPEGVRRFRDVFNGAQSILGATFGMSMVELPAREKNDLKARRAAATQASAVGAARGESQGQGGRGKDQQGSKSWILISTLPAIYKSAPNLLPPPRAPSSAAEAQYVGLYTLIIALIYLNGSCVSENKLERYLRRVGASGFISEGVGGSIEKVLGRMVRDGYVVKGRDTSSGEEVVEWRVGPRGKVEVGRGGVQGLVERVFGAEGMDGEAREELGRRIRSSLGLGGGREDDGEGEEEGGGVADTNDNANAGGHDAPRRRGRPPKNGTGRRRNVDDDGDGEDD